MSALEVAVRLNGKPSGIGKWSARCPAHDDGHPSLSIAEGRDGRTVLHCFKGCGVEAIVHAAGLSLGDLFEHATMPIPRAPHRPNAAELHLALACEERDFREHHGVEGLLRTSEVNAIRATIAKRYGVELAPIARPLYEGGFGGRERDPAWPALFDWAISVASATLLATTLAFDETLRPPRSVLIVAEELAAAAMHDLERQARERRSIAA